MTNEKPNSSTSDEQTVSATLTPLELKSSEAREKRLEEFTEARNLLQEKGVALTSEEAHEILDSADYRDQVQGTLDSSLYIRFHLRNKEVEILVKRGGYPTPDGMPVARIDGAKVTKKVAKRLFDLYAGLIKAAAKSRGDDKKYDSAIWKEREEFQREKFSEKIEQNTKIAKTGNDHLADDLLK